MNRTGEIRCGGMRRELYGQNTIRAEFVLPSMTFASSLVPAPKTQKWRREGQTVSLGHAGGENKF